jgi:eukaryotic-like serine/threonine-protein kinase
LDAQAGDPATARLEASAALAASQGRNVRCVSAIALARIGDAAGSKQVIQSLAAEFPTDTMVNHFFLPVARAVNELQQNQAGKAVATLDPARPYELARGPGWSARFWPIYVQAGALLRLHDGAKAAAEYQRILDHRGVDPVDPLYVLARLGIGRAYVVQGDTAKARAAYQDFFSLWKDADPDIPILKQAKAEYAKLQ